MVATTTPAIRGMLRASFIALVLEWTRAYHAPLVKAGIEAVEKLLRGIDEELYIWCARWRHFPVQDQEEFAKLKADMLRFLEWIQVEGPDGRACD